MHFQYQLGYLTDEFYESTFKQTVRRLAPVWQELETLLGVQRPSFQADIERILADAEEQS